MIDMIVLIKNVLSDHVFLYSILTKPFFLVPAFGDHLTYSLSRALLVFSIKNQFVSSQFPYRDAYSLNNSSTFFISCALASRERGGGVLPYKRLMGMCRWMGSHFQ